MAIDWSKSKIGGKAVPPDRSKTMGSSLEPGFLQAWKMHGDTERFGEPVGQYKFHPTRKWPFDFAWPALMVAVEMEGGIYTQGRHTRGPGFQRDCEKYNVATLLGWRILRYTTGDLNKKPIQMIEEVVALLERAD